MTIKEAENQYYHEVENCREQHIMKAKKAILIWNIIGSLLIVVGLILMIIGFTTPPEIDSFGYEWEPIGALFEKAYGIVSLGLGVFFILLLNLGGRRAIKKGPRNFLPQIKNLYLNYLKCDDMSNDEKEFYKQKLENIRNMELVNAIQHSASVAASTAIMFSTLHK